MTEDNALDVLEVGEMYLMKGLVRQCAVFIGRNLSVENVIAYHYYARMFNLPRLEDQCVAFMAQYLDQVFIFLLFVCHI